MYEEIKTRLNKLQDLEVYLSDVNDQIAEMEYSKYCPKGVNYSRDRIQTSCRNDGMITVVARTEDLIKLRFQIEQNIKECKSEIHTLVAYIDNDERREMFIDRFIGHKSMRQIAREKTKSYEWIKKLFRKSFSEIEKRC